MNGVATSSKRKLGGLDKLTGSIEGVARMVAAGLGLEENTFLEAGKYGSHLLAPTATDLDKYGELNM